MKESWGDVMERSTVLATTPGSWVRMGMCSRASTRHGERSNGVTGLERGTNRKPLRQRDIHFAHKVNTHDQETELLKET